MMARHHGTRGGGAFIGNGVVEGALEGANE